MDIDEWAGMPSGEPIKGKTYRADGWVYRDMPGKLSHELWDKILAMLGKGNYVVFIMSEGADWRRGQLLISPTGMDNLAIFLENKNAS